MGEYKQQNRELKVKCPLGEDDLLLKGFVATEGISQLFNFRVEMLAENKTKIPFDALIGQKFTVQIRQPDESYQSYNGVCVKLGQGEKDFVFTTYFAELVPEFWLLTRKSQSRIFQQMTVPDILKKVLTGVNTSFQIQGNFEPRDYCVQYRETDYNFASRLMEEEGIYYFFKHSDGSHQMVLANTPSGHPDVPGDSSIIFEEVEGGTRDENRIWGWRKEQLHRSGKYTLWDHCFELPHKHLETERMIQDSAKLGKETHKLKIAGNDSLELYDWPGEYAQRFDGIAKGGGEQQGELQKIFQDNQRTVRIRMEEETAPALNVRAQSNCKHLATGHKFKLKRHFNADGEYVIVTMNHAAHFGADYRAQKDALLSYENDFVAMPSSVPFRPRRSTPKPVVPGSQSAVVVGPKGEELFTDKYGRVKVQFHWDREGKNDEGSSCWIRVAQLVAGRRWGAFFWPRIGQEVIVDFLEGDPDQPIIVGCVYNADQMPPYLGNGPDSKHRNDNKVMGLKSNTTEGGVGFNEMRFDDTKDRQQVFIHAERDMDTRVKRTSMESVLNDKHLTVGGGEDGSKKQGDFRELVYRDRQIHVKRHQDEHLGGDVKLHIGGGDEGSGNWDVLVDGKKTETIGKDYDLHVKQAMKEKVDTDKSLTVGNNLDEKAGMSWAIEAGQSIHIKAGMTMVLEAGMQLSLKVGGNFVDINPAGVFIQGTLVMINSGGSAGSGSGASPSSPSDAAEAKPEDPIIADDAETGQKSCS
jgi:type VI secretion system secreted protein VgrG